MRPLTAARPKVMQPVAGKPMVEHLLIECRKAGLTDFVLIVGYHDEKVRGYFGDGSAWGARIRYVLQRQPAGTADALRQALPLLNTSFIMLNGDIMLRAADIAPLSRMKVTTLSLVELADVTGMGVVELEGECVILIHEKTLNPPTHLANAGVYYFTQDVVAALAKTPRSPRGEFEITDTIQLMIDAGVPVGFRMLNTWRDLGYPWDLLSANEEFLSGIESRIEGKVEDGAVLKGAVEIGSGSIVRAGSYIVGPVIIGQNCDIGPNCYLRPGTAIGNNCHIGASVEIKNSIIMANTKIPHLTYVGDSIIGENCNLGAGTQVANLRFDRSNARVNGKDTGRRKMGAIIGDNVSTGINASINLGTFIGSGAIIGPGALVSGVIAPGARIL
ncbi:bifunctional UDP-N-acetylglucosamine pyrophosphorylase / Glucosamine-1-phosphate N-acetyltransferase [Dehalogenimonas formicexedens]|uniref:Bifunctional UDP-N-acetylglucosamine pyrophosphorylase / Glucosamine-1-phosphate N-acetyltransferase n=2 Tax=Dehalogenimonas formicexedens TaxID=1839801 RepID=A0A1P8F9N2_9CHLR|nr:bifunctional UDP-N-acetylglucosamine pyrophosphorylase / Glucosamine-1-phosphate N-acetyltransferase [Dehalogenimonas formicexedens]